MPPRAFWWQWPCSSAWPPIRPGFQPRACRISPSETYETSVQIANLSLLPKVNATTPETLIVANGFSCREQIEDLADRETLHLADVLARTLA